MTQVRYYSPKRRRAMYLGDKVKPLCLFAICDWTCGICKERIDPEARFPSPDCATVDHITPLAAGGLHTWANCQPAHKRCNEAKGSTSSS